MYYIYISVYALHIHMYALRTHACTDTHTHIYICNAYICPYVYACICMHVCMYTHRGNHTTNRIYVICRVEIP